MENFSLFQGLAGHGDERTPIRCWIAVLTKNDLLGVIFSYPPNKVFLTLFLVPSPKDFGVTVLKYPPK